MKQIEWCHICEGKKQALGISCHNCKGTGVEPSHQQMDLLGDDDEGVKAAPRTAETEARPKLVLI